MILALHWDCTITKRKLHCPWCGDDTGTLSLGIGMHQAMVWSKAADHHGALGIAFSAATRVDLFDPKSIVEEWYISMYVEDKIRVICQKTPPHDI